MKSANGKKAFTIVEMVVVIAIIGILAAVMIPLFAGTNDKTDLSTDKQRVKSMNTALCVEQGLGDAPDFDEAKADLAKRGFRTFSATAEGYEIYWVPVENVVVLCSERTNRVVFPEELLGEKVAGDWRLLTDE